MAGLNDKEFKDFNDIVQNTLNSLIDCADKHNIDRDSFIKYFSAIFGTMAEVSTFTNYTSAPKERGGGEVKIIYNTIAVLFCILTLGFVDLNIKYSDKTQFKWVGWISRIIQCGD